MNTRRKLATKPPEIDLDRVVWDVDYRKWAQRALKDGVPKTSKRDRESRSPAER